MSPAKILQIHNISNTKSIHFTLKSTDKTTIYIDKYIIKPTFIHEIPPNLVSSGGTLYLELYTTSDKIWWTGYVQSSTQQPIIVDIENGKISCGDRNIVNTYKDNNVSHLSWLMFITIALIIILLAIFYYKNAH